jgi:hypothetical protein
MADAQGIDRITRGINYWNYLRSGFNASHRLVVIPGCMHDAVCMYNSPGGQTELFQ